MKLLLAGLLAASTIAVAAPAVAQGVYVGPGGVGVDTGLRYRGYDRDRDGYRDGYYGRRPAYEGRSTYRDHDRMDRRYDRD